MYGLRQQFRLTITGWLQVQASYNHYGEGGNASLTICDPAGTIESLVDACIRRWVDNNPQAAQDFADSVKTIREGVITKGTYTEIALMGSQGEFQFEGYIPNRLHFYMTCVFHKDWDQDDQIKNVFWKKFTIGALGRPGKKGPNAKR